MGENSKLVNWAELVRPDQVHGSVYTDQAIFRMELEKDRKSVV